MLGSVCSSSFVQKRIFLLSLPAILPWCRGEKLRCSPTRYSTPSSQGSLSIWLLRHKEVSLQIQGQSTIVAAEKACSSRLLAHGPSGCLAILYHHMRVVRVMNILCRCWRSTCFLSCYAVIAAYYMIHDCKGWCASRNAACVHILSLSLNAHCLAATAEFKRSSVGENDVEPRLSFNVASQPTSRFDPMSVANGR